MNSDSIRGLKGTAHNCSVIAMDNCGLQPDATCLTKKGMYIFDLERTLYKQADIIKVVGFGFGRCCLREFVRRHPEGIFITCSRNHYAAVVDGKIFNSRRNQQIKYAWRIIRREPGNLVSIG